MSETEKNDITDVKSRKDSKVDGGNGSGFEDAVRKNSKRESTKLPVVDKPLDLDDVLVNELGQFGRYQFKNILLVAFPIFFAAFMSDFVFTSASLPHRCMIPECGEESKDAVFEPEWILNAVPETSSGFASCERYVPVASNGSLSYCPAYVFDQTETTECDGIVYGRDNSLAYDFDLGCQEWRRALVGTLGNVGALLALPIAGFISDKYGRRVILVFSVFNTAFIGIIRAFSFNFPMTLTLQLLWTTFGSASYSSAYIFATELVGPKYRVITSATCSSLFALGQVMLGGLAWLVQPWRHLILVLFAPCFLLVSYYWILSESVRWLLAKRKFEKAKEVLETVARVNRTNISEKSMTALLNPAPPANVGKTATNDSGLVKAIFRSPILLRRVCTTPIWWIATTFIYYGLSINSVSLSDTMYLNYILASAIEIPGYYLAVILLGRIGRRSTLFSGFFLSAVCSLAFAFVANNQTAIRMTLFLVGKFGIAIVFTSVYLYTAELYPTEYRHSLHAFSSMVGRIGSITAPLTPVLMDYWQGLPSVLFATMGFLAAALVLTQPDTMGTKLPDTLAEAEALGRPESKINRTTTEAS